MKRSQNLSLIFVLLVMLISGAALAQTTPASPANASDAKWPAPSDPSGYRIALFDTDEPPSWYPMINPYSKLASMNSWNHPVMDHTGQPHAHGHVIQVIMDGGNGVQDPPKADGTPGGDDSLAYGNFNMIRLVGLLDPTTPGDRSGKFFSQRYFIPFVDGRAHYLRLWEGDDVATAPYYQDSSEYDAETDRGGAMIMIPSGPPIDVQWKFGPSKPRPKA